MDIDVSHRLVAGKGTNHNKTLFQNAVKCVFYLDVMEHHYTDKLNAFQRISLKESKKEEINTVNLVLLPQKQETCSSYLTL